MRGNKSESQLILRRENSREQVGTLMAIGTLMMAKVVELESIQMETLCSIEAS